MESKELEQDRCEFTHFKDKVWFCKDVKSH